MTNNNITITAVSILEVSNAITDKGPKVSKEIYDAHVPAFVSKSGFISPDWVAFHGGAFERAVFRQADRIHDQIKSFLVNAEANSLDGSEDLTLPAGYTPTQEKLLEIAKEAFSEDWDRVFTLNGSGVDMHGHRDDNFGTISLKANGIHYQWGL